MSNFNEVRRNIRVTTLPASGEIGIDYIIEPGSTVWQWNDITSAWVQVESRVPPTPAYPRRLRDIG